MKDEKKKSMEKLRSFVMRPVLYMQEDGLGRCLFGESRVLSVLARTLTVA